MSSALITSPDYWLVALFATTIATGARFTSRLRRFSPRIIGGVAISLVGYLVFPLIGLWLDWYPRVLVFGDLPGRETVCVDTVSELVFDACRYSGALLAFTAGFYLVYRGQRKYAV